MFDWALFLWLIPALPLAGSVLIALFGNRGLRNFSHWPCILGIAGSCVLSFVLLAAVADRPPDAPFLKTYYTWIQAGDVDVGYSLRADSLTAIMLVTVTFVGSLIAIYSVGYMHDDPGYPRFFAEIALFVFAMTGLVLADNFLVLYAFWEGVGLCSYLLIGFWFNKARAAAAARKAFLVTRIGDFGFILGIILLWITFGHRLDFETVFQQASAHPGAMATIALLLFCGAVGKSAQFPLHIWLPDAMEGPSPVSALIHAATMVTAGVYMVARCMPLFHVVPEVLLVVASTGAFTALLAALIALTQTDLKRVLAYSTISQLGYMFLALGSGTTDALVKVAVVAAIFHLFTHAFFKALLFLGAGSVMHAMGNVIDMRCFGGLRHVLKTTHWTFLCGALALAGFPFLSGFWSKDDILSVTFHAASAGNPYHFIYLVLFMAALVTAGLTAFYTFRAYFLTFWGEERIPPEAGHHAHESPPVMLIPLMILAAGAVAIGFVVEPLTHGFSGFLLKTLQGLSPENPTHEMNGLSMTLSGLMALGGIGLAWWMYVRQPGFAGRVVQNIQGLYQLSLNQFHFDELYFVFLVAPFSALARFCGILDLYVVDSLVDLVGHVPRLLGFGIRLLQNGLVQYYALAMALGLTVFLLALMRALAG